MYILFIFNLDIRMKNPFLDVKKFCHSFTEGVFVDNVEHIVRNLHKPAAYATKHDLPIIIWWTSFTKGNEIKRCNLGECYITEARKFQKHPRTKAFMFYGTSFLASDVPLPRHRKSFHNFSVWIFIS